MLGLNANTVKNDENDQNPLSFYLLIRQIKTYIDIFIAIADASINRHIDC